MQRALPVSKALPMPMALLCALLAKSTAPPGCLRLPEFAENEWVSRSQVSIPIFALLGIMNGLGGSCFLVLSRTILLLDFLQTQHFVILDF